MTKAEALGKLRRVASEMKRERRERGAVCADCVRVMRKLARMIRAD